jgi:hypothetical protein
MIRRGRELDPSRIDDRLRHDGRRREDQDRQAENYRPPDLLKQLRPHSFTPGRSQGRGPSSSAQSEPDEVSSLRC